MTVLMVPLWVRLCTGSVGLSLEGGTTGGGDGRGRSALRIGPRTACVGWRLFLHLAFTVGTEWCVGDGDRGLERERTNRIATVRVRTLLRAAEIRSHPAPTRVPCCFLGLVWPGRLTMTSAPRPGGDCSVYTLLDCATYHVHVQDS